ncbi:MFS-type transporter SLC18B1-like [Neocloeon triangulifer]|uniref:MFS-type transporter SLC18B1-like n=1 Tax=Neocloeon triangulifer TaxID=2078957 RepID=UPI00286F2248|nr:MFS-type transporter SLC18B1-like [Neocloeon triangulifer]
MAFDEKQPLIEDNSAESSAQTAPDTPAKTATTGLTKRQWLTVVVFGIANFIAALCISLQAPFYPEEAEAKGASATEYGFVFGIYELTSFISCPIFGVYLPKLGPRFVYNAGIFVTAGSCILFGVLDLVRQHVSFLALSFAVRVVEALGSAGTLTATFAIIAAEFPQSVATTFASLETFFGLGLIVGPTIGGLLYQIGGFLLPFLVTGLVLLVGGIVSVILLPSEDGCTQLAAANAVATRNSGLIAILKVPSVSLSAVSIVVSSMSIGFISATLEPHLRQFGLSPVLMGVMFIVSGGMYALIAPFAGYLCDKGVGPKVLASIGNVCVASSYMLVGPAPFFPINTILWMVIIGLLIHGTGIGLLLVSAFIDALHSATKNGFPDDISTYAIVSGLWASAFALGAFIGPSIGGVMLDFVGFRWGSLVIVSIHIISFFAHLIFLRVESRQPRYTEIITEEFHPLLGGSHHIKA